MTDPKSIDRKATLIHASAGGKCRARKIEPHSMLHHAKCFLFFCWDVYAQHHVLHDDIMIQGGPTLSPQRTHAG